MTAECISLVVKAMERDGMDIRPISTRERFRDSIITYNGHTMLWYESKLSDGTYTSKIVEA